MPKMNKFTRARRYSSGVFIAVIVITAIFMSTEVVGASAWTVLKYRQCQRAEHLW